MRSTRRTARAAAERGEAFLRIEPEDLRVMERRVRAPTTPQRLVRRTRIVLLSAEGLPAADVARRLGTSLRTVRLWTDRFVAGGVSALERDAPGRGRKPAIDAERARQIVALHRKLAATDAASASVRRIARLVGVSAASVHRVLRRVETEPK